MERSHLTGALALAIIGTGLGIGATLRPVTAGIQADAAPIERGVLITIYPTESRRVPKAHWGVYALSRYDYTPGGKMIKTPLNDLIVEQDMNTGNLGNRAGLKLKSGEYEIHVQPDNCRPIVKRFLVDNLNPAAAITLAFNPAPIDDPEERKKTEFVRLGPSLAELEARLAVLEKKNGIAAPGK